MTAEQMNREVCTKDNPKPKLATGRWIHPEAIIVGGCAEGCCDDYECPVCGQKWRIEYDG